MAAKSSSSNIKEANEHIQALHKRVYELESQLQMHVLHIEELEKKNTDLQRLVIVKDEEIVKSRLNLTNLESKLAETQSANVTNLEEIQTKAKLFDELLVHKSVLESVIGLLNSSITKNN